ncbi:MAG: hypothetical protein LBV68_07955 [Spirochaetaceae bacterium]|jgi:hypothetical protein|nr:hypothetical protein [Spirochaetaceae bacterium]
MKNKNRRNKHRVSGVFVLLCVTGVLSALLCPACSTSGISSKQTKTWISGDNFSAAKKLALGKIDIDKIGGGWSVEREIAGILPLIFLEHDYVFLQEGEHADYLVDVYAVERDYYDGWKSKKSIAIEVVFGLLPGATEETAVSSSAQELTGNDPDVKNATEIRLKTPFAAGRTIAEGSLGLSSSKNLEALLRLSVEKLVKSIQRHAGEKERQKQTGKRA